MSPVLTAEEPEVEVADFTVVLTLSEFRHESLEHIAFPVWVFIFFRVLIIVNAISGRIRGEERARC